MVAKFDIHLVEETKIQGRAKYQTCRAQASEKETKVKTTYSTDKIRGN